MKPISISLLVASLSIVLSTTALALTVDHRVSPTYVREHPQEFAISVSVNQDGLFKFTIVRTLSKPTYLVAHLSVQQDGKTIAESHTPQLSKKGDNRFHFSVAQEYLAESSFEIGESAARDGVALPGTKRFQFQLQDFVPERLMKTVSKK